MQCADFLEFLEQEPDGPLPASASDHLEDCSECRTLFDELEGIRLAGFEYGSEEEAAPHPRVWAALRSQLELEGLIGEPQPVRRARWFDWAPLQSLRPAFVALSVPLLLAAGALLQVRGTSHGSSIRASMFSDVSLASAGSPFAEEIDHNLDSEIRLVMASLPARPSSLANALQENLTIVDNMIARCEKSVREQPDNPLAREYLYGAYQQKAVLLSTAMERTTREDR